MTAPGDITEILNRGAVPTPDASRELFAALYPELRRMADARLLREGSDHTWQPTELVHEAYLRMVDQTRVQWSNRSHFLAVAAQAMRRILVDHARSRSRVKRGRGWEKVTLDEALSLGAAETDEVLLDLDDALTALQGVDEQKGRLVEMRFFGGLSMDECAEVLGISPRSAARYWEFAQAWLYREMTREPR